MSIKEYGRIELGRVDGVNNILITEFHFENVDLFEAKAEALAWALEVIKENMSCVKPDSQ